MLFQRKYSGNEIVNYKGLSYRVCKSGADKDSYNHIMYKLHRGNRTLHVRGDKITS